MPACSECGKTKSRLNTGNLCRECFSRAGNNGSQLDGDDYITGINISKPLNELSVGDLVAIMAVFILRRIVRLRRRVHLNNYSLRQYKHGTNFLDEGILTSFLRLNLCV